MTAVVAASIAVGATFAVTRKSVSARLRWQVGAGFLVIAVGLVVMFFVKVAPGARVRS